MSSAAAAVRDALGAATDAIAAAGSDTARLDAELLLCEATGWDRARLASQPDARLPVGASRGFGEMVRRRVQREPVAYILGRRGFRRIELLVDRRVLIPRPETELLVEVALELRPRTVLDVGTGSGAVALAVADELPEAEVRAIDISTDALGVAQANVDRFDFGGRIELVAEGIESLLLPPSLDLLVANLPYVSEAEWDGLEPEVREYEPRGALVCGPTGLEAIEMLAQRLAGLAGLGERPSAIALEVGAGQAPAVAEAVRGIGYESVEARTDLAGIERVVVGR